MDIKSLKNSIMTNKIPNFLIFNVTNQALCKQYIGTMSTTLGKHYKYYDTLEEVLHETSVNLKEDFIYIVLNDKQLLKGSILLDHAKVAPRNIILYFTEIDKSSVLYKDFNEYVVTFKNLDRYTILAYLERKLKLSGIEVDQEYLLTLIEYCDNDLGCCLNELDKIIVLGQSKSNLVFEYMLQKGFSDFRKVDVFKFINKVLNKDMSVFDDAIQISDNVITITTLLYNQAKQRFEKESLTRYVDIMGACFEIDSGIKDGTLSDVHALDILLLKIM